MNPSLRRAYARQLWTTALVLCAVAGVAVASDAEPSALTLDDAARIAATAQPLIEAQRSAARGAREAAVAAAQLPDPMLVGGLTDLTITGPDRFTLTDETDTQFMLGVKQGFPGGNKRALRGSRGRAEAERLDAEVDAEARMARREAALAWLDVWKAVRAQALTRAALTESQRQVESTDIAYRASRASQADLLAARVSAELLEDQLASLQQQEWHARNQLGRWIGDAADRPIAGQLPEWPAPNAAFLLAHLEHHPHVSVQERAVLVAQADLDLAKAEYRPDWSLQASYGYRPEFADYASLQFEMGLPYFTRNRQDRMVVARAAEIERVQQVKEDVLRQNRAAIARNVADWQRLRQRLERYDRTILPQARLRVESSLSAYGAGASPLLAVLDARRSVLDIAMQRLELQFDAARHQVELQYYAYAGEAQP